MYPATGFNLGNMRYLSNLVPCVISPSSKKPDEREMLPTKSAIQRTGRDHSVLLTIVENQLPPKKFPPPIAPSAVDQSTASPIHVMDASTSVDKDIPDDSPLIDDDGRCPVKLNRFNQLPHAQIEKVKKLKLYWHKIVVLRGAGYTNYEIVHALYEHVSPLSLGFGICKYRREGSSFTFLLRHKLPVLLKLCGSEESVLKVQFNGPNGLEMHFLDVEVILRHTPIEDFCVPLEELLSNCLARRYDKNLRMLDLSALHEDPEFSEMVVLPIWMPNAQLLLRRFVLNFYPDIRWLNLSSNELSKVPSFLLKKLEILDLSSNKIQDIRALSILKGTAKFMEINLDRNPLCAAFPNEVSYIKAILEYFPSVKKIDGVTLIRPDLPVWRRHFVLTGRQECVALVDQFLQHFFTLLDSGDRQRLRGMYHPEAMFSLTCNYVPGQSTSSTARLTRYTLESRNLMKMSDYSKSQQLLSQGAEEVLAALSRLPHTEHDPYSFSVDLPYYTQDILMIVVNGVFREPSMMNEHLIRAFSRTFILRKVASKEFQIINEMLSVSNASTKQAEESFRYPRPKVSLAKLSFNPAQDLTDSDRQQMTKILSRLTEMNQRWSRKCLEESKWDIKDALLVFTELLKMEKLPGEAFDLEEDRTGEKK